MRDCCTTLNTVTPSPGLRGALLSTTKIQELRPFPVTPPPHDFSTRSQMWTIKVVEDAKVSPLNPANVMFDLK